MSAVIWVLIFLPVLSGLACFAMGCTPVRRGLVIATAALHLTLALATWGRGTVTVVPGWIALDDLSRLFLTITSVLFLAAAVYGVHYLRSEAARDLTDAEEGFLFRNAGERWFCGFLCLFLATMTLATVSRHMGLIWIAVEATTLVSAPLIYFHRHHRSLEATWKYLMICSVGIAIALLGNFFLAVATTAGTGKQLALSIGTLQVHAAALHPAWLKAAFILLLVGYGTKMGLVPMHTWLPDAHSEAPSMVSALLSGALLNCALLAILRIHGIMVAAALGDFAGGLLVLFGLLSMIAAGLLLVTQPDYKRLLAYSSVEHMGVIAFGVGVGGLALRGAMMHVFYHSLAKAALFMTAGNILAFCQTKDSRRACGLAERLPWTGMLWLAGAFAIVGSPPFGLFLSEFTILKGALAAGSPWLAVGYLAALAVAFAAIVSVALRMVFGAPTDANHTATPAGREGLLAVVPPTLLLAGALVLGLWLPAGLDALVKSAAALAGGAR